jgi:hypothetical protein
MGHYRWPETANTSRSFSAAPEKYELIFMDIQRCAVRTLAVTPTCRNITWSTEWFVLKAVSNVTLFEKYSIITDFQVASFN